MTKDSIQKVVSISNPQSPYFKEKGKILSTNQDETVEIFLFQSEIIVVLKLSDISKNSSVYIPKTRKDFYQYIQSPETTRTDIVKTTKKLIENKTIVISSNFSEESLFKTLEDSDKDKSQLVEEFRTLRDQNYLEFNLINSQPSAFYKKPFHKNPKRR